MTCPHILWLCLRFFCLLPILFRWYVPCRKVFVSHEDLVIFPHSLGCVLLAMWYAGHGGSILRLWSSFVFSHLLSGPWWWYHLDSMARILFSNSAVSSPMWHKILTKRNALSTKYYTFCWQWCLRHVDLLHSKAILKKRKNSRINLICNSNQASPLWLL